MSLANKVNHTEINHEIDPFIDNITTLFEETSKEELIKKFFSVEFNRFYNYYKKAHDINASDKGSHKEIVPNLQDFSSPGKQRWLYMDEHERFLKSRA